MKRLRLAQVDRPLFDGASRTLLALLVAWVPVLLLVELENDPQGDWTRFFNDHRVQAQLLFAVPAMLAGEFYIGGRVSEAVKRILMNRLLLPPDLINLQKILRQAAWERDSVRVEMLILLLSYLLCFMEFKYGKPLYFAPDTGALSMAVLWYAVVSLSLFWFLLLRWVWRFFIWCRVLLSLARLDLQVVPTHADRTGGIHYFAACQASFSVVVFAIGAVVSAVTRKTEGLDLSEAVTKFGRIQLLYTACALVVLHLPLVAFSKKLVDAKRWADAHFSALVAEHGRAFQAKWFDPHPGQSPLAAQGMSSQADITTAFEAAGRMRWLPYGLRPFIAIVTSAFFLPLIPRLIAEHELLDALLKAMPRLI